jgi:hypothetical protein
MVAAALPPTAVDTGSALQAAVNDRLHQSRGPVMVLTDQTLDGADGRAIRIAPDRAVKNIGITAISARAIPHPQVMLRLTNNANESSVHLSVRSGATVVEKEVNFTGGSATELIDFPKFGDSVDAEIISHDDIPADDAVWLTRIASGVSFDLTGGVPAEVRRIATIYMHNRPAGSHVLVSDRAVPAGQRGIEIVPGNLNSMAIIPLTTAIDPLTIGVMAWPGPAAANAKPPDGDRILLQRDGVALVAAHESSLRQIWINLDLATWSRTTDFVVFFSNVFESFRSNGPEDFASVAPVLLGPEWKKTDELPSPEGVPPGLWPGLYRSDDGRLLAVDALVPPMSQTATPVKNITGSAVNHAVNAGLPLSPFLCCLALLGVVSSAICWPRARLASAQG